MTDKLINWYENPKVRKYMKDLPDKQFEKTILKNNLGDTICVLAKK